MGKQPMPWSIRPADELRAKVDAIVAGGSRSRHRWLLDVVESVILATEGVDVMFPVPLPGGRLGVVELSFRELGPEGRQVLQQIQKGLEVARDHPERLVPDPRINRMLDDD